MLSSECFVEKTMYYVDFPMCFVENPVCLAGSAASDAGKAGAVRRFPYILLRMRHSCG